MDDKMLSISEAAKLMGVCENTLRDWDIEGKFKAERTLGNHRRYSLERIRAYLNENVPEPEETRVQKQTVKDFAKKWELKGLIPNDLSDNEKNILAMLLENSDSLNSSEANPLFSNAQFLWLTQQGFLRSKLRKTVNFQPMMGPCSLVFYMKHRDCGGVTVESEALAARTYKLSFSIFENADFEKVKDAYADAIAGELDLMIFDKLPRCNIEKLVDGSFNDSIVDGREINLKAIYDYIVGPKEMIELLRNKPLCEGVDLFEVPMILDADSFLPRAVAGKYPVSTLTPPILCHYIFFSVAPLMGVSRSVFSRSVWHPSDDSLRKKLEDNLS